MAKKYEILKEIRDRMFNITTANGYYHDIKRVDISRQKSFQSNEIPAINVHYRGDEPSQQNFGSGERIMSILIGGFSTSQVKDLTAAEISFELEEDIISALNRTSTSPAKTDQPDFCLGGLVKEVTEHSSAPINQGGHSPFVGVLIEFEVRYLLDIETLA